MNDSYTELTKYVNTFIKVYPRTFYIDCPIDFNVKLFYTSQGRSIRVYHEANNRFIAFTEISIACIIPTILLQ